MGRCKNDEEPIKLSDSVNKIVESDKQTTNYTTNQNKQTDKPAELKDKVNKVGILEDAVELHHVRVGHCLVKPAISVHHYLR